MFPIGPDTISFLHGVQYTQSNSFPWFHGENQIALEAFLHIFPLIYSSDMKRRSLRQSTECGPPISRQLILLIQVRVEVWIQIQIQIQIRGRRHQVI